MEHGHTAVTSTLDPRPALSGLLANSRLGSQLQTPGQAITRPDRRYRPLGGPAEGQALSRARSLPSSHASSPQPHPQVAFPWVRKLGSGKRGDLSTATRRWHLAAACERDALTALPTSSAPLEKWGLASDPYGEPARL